MSKVLKETQVTSIVLIKTVEKLKAIFKINFKFWDWAFKKD